MADEKPAVELDGEEDADATDKDEEVLALLEVAEEICDPAVDAERKQEALEHLSISLRPQHFPPRARHLFVQRAIARGVVTAAAQLIESTGTDLAAAASNFLGDFAFNSDAGARAVLQVFDRLADCFRHVFEHQPWTQPALLDAAVLLCVNIAATCPSGHSRLVPLVRPVCLQILRNPSVTDKLRGNTILLLANLSMTVGQELAALGVGEVLLDLVLEGRVSELGRSVAESVVIFLHGHERCSAVDRLIQAGVVGHYCVPIMEMTLRGEEFRGMYPHLLYSARLFQVLAQSQEYAAALVAHERVVPLLLQANCQQRRPPRVESDIEGRRLALEALRSFAHFGLWPRGQEEDPATRAFLVHDLPLLLDDAHTGIRGAAAGLWAALHPGRVASLLLVGHRLQAEGKLPAFLWRERVITYLFPCVAAGCDGTPP